MPGPHSTWTKLYKGYSLFLLPGRYLPLPLLMVPILTVAAVAAPNPMPSPLLWLVRLLRGLAFLDGPPQMASTVHRKKVQVRRARGHCSAVLVGSRVRRHLTPMPDDIWLLCM